jgi:hypothetical protein
VRIAKITSISGTTFTSGIVSESSSRTFILSLSQSFSVH